MQVIYPPDNQVIRFHERTIFLAGSIEMGVADNWQDRMIEALKDYDVVIFNPRRKDWDSTWKQSIDDPNFNAQVNWELDRLTESDIVIFYFDPTTKSPITLYELGRFGEGSECIVCCPEGFWRKGNVDIACKRDKILQVDTFDQLVAKVKEII